MFVGRDNRSCVDGSCLSYGGEMLEYLNHENRHLTMRCTERRWGVSAMAERLEAASVSFCR